jgi:transposase
VSADQPAPSYDELAGLIVRLEARLRGLEAELAAERAARAEERAAGEAALAAAAGEIESLRAQVAANSRNSSKPPSSDGLAKPPAPRSQRKKTGRKPGGQDGHAGRTLEMSASPDWTVVHEPAVCAGCGDALLLAPVTRVERRQVVDLPAVRPEVVEHQLVERECSCCGTRTKAAAPTGVDAPVQYGPGVEARVLYLYAGQFLAKDRAALAMAELFGTPLSAGTVAAMLARAAGRLAERFLPDVRDQLSKAAVVGADETGLRVAGKLHWVHCARTEKLTLVVVHPRRGREGIRAVGVLPDYRGTVVHDCWAPYDAFVDADHQLCCAHVVRELVAVAESMPDVAWCWATQAREALVDLQKLAADARAAGAAALDPALVVEPRRRLRHAVAVGISETETRSSKLMRKHNALAHRLADREIDYLRFLTDLSIPPDNNGSERDIRMVKIRQKISGCLRSLTGARQFCALRSYLSTTAKHGIAMLNALTRLAAGQPWLPSDTDTPALAA